MCIAILHGKWKNQTPFLNAWVITNNHKWWENSAAFFFFDLRGLVRKKCGVELCKPAEGKLKNCQRSHKVRNGQSWLRITCFHFFPNNNNSCYAIMVLMLCSMLYSPQLWFFFVLSSLTISRYAVCLFFLFCLKDNFSMSSSRTHGGYYYHMPWCPLKIWGCATPPPFLNISPILDHFVSIWFILGHFMSLWANFIRISHRFGATTFEYHLCLDVLLAFFI